MVRFHTDEGHHGGGPDRKNVKKGPFSTAKGPFFTFEVAKCDLKNE